MPGASQTMEPETGLGPGRERYDWSFDIRLLRQDKVSFRVIYLAKILEILGPYIESKHEALK